MEVLEEGMAPARVFEIMRGGGPKDVFTEEAVQDRLRSYAITILRHEQIMVRERGNDFASNDPLLYFIYQVHGEEMDPRIILSVTSFSSTPFLSLGYWDSMYYALIVKIRVLRQRMTDADDEQVLHNYGITAASIDQPYTISDFRRLLGNIWASLMNSGLLGPLERAVRIQNYAEALRTCNRNHAHEEDFQVVWAGNSDLEKDEILDRMAGMKDVLRMDLERIHDHMKRVCIEKNRRACLRELAPTEPPTLPSSDENPCCCDQRCGCRIVCQFGIHSCECGRRKTAPAPAQSLSPIPTRTRTNTTTSSTLHDVPEPPSRQIGRGKQVYPTGLYGENASYEGFPRLAPSSPEQHAAPLSPPPATAKPPESAVRPAGRRLISAGGDMPFDQRPLLAETLPEPEEQGITMTKEQFAALPRPRRASPSQGEAKAPRRPSWVKKIFSRKNSSAE